MGGTSIWQSPTCVIIDTDGDGTGDIFDDFPNNANETNDSDGDGIGDNGDAFPNNANETADSDGDGIGDNGDAFPNDPDESADTDGDGVGDNEDAFPEDADRSEAGLDAALTFFEDSTGLNGWAVIGILVLIL